MTSDAACLVLVANAGDGTITTLALDPAADGSDGPRLRPLATSGDLPGCGTFAVDAGRDLVHAAYKGVDGGRNGIATLRLDRATGVLTEVARVDVEASMTYLTLAPGGGTLLGASYGGGVGLAWRVDAGRVGEVLSRFERRNLHCVVEADGWVYAVSLGEDLICQFRLGPGGELVPLATPTVQLTPGIGARHLVVAGTNGYLVTEYSGEVVRLVRTLAGGSAGELRVAETATVVDPSLGLGHSRFGADPRAEHLVWGADVHVAHPAGRGAGGVLLTSERMSSLLTATALDADGSLGETLGSTPTEDQPRGFAVSPCGRYVVAVGERSTHAALARVEADGALTPLDRVPVGRGANWVRFA